MGNYIEQLALSIGTSAPALKLLLSLVFGFPLALVHRRFLHGAPETYQHVFFSISGIGIGYFNFGPSILHCIIATTASYLILYLFKPSRLSVALTWILNMSYLTIGYYFTETNDYNILWTIPQCVLCLRMNGLVFDLYDSHQTRTANKPQKLTYLEELPSLLAVMAYVFFPTTFLIGPQYPITRYFCFVHNDFDPFLHQLQLKPPSIRYAMRKLFQAIFYTGIAQIGVTNFPNSYFLSAQYLQESFSIRMLYLGIWGRLTLYKYVGVWFLAESTSALFGLTYNGREVSTGKIKWNGLENVKINYVNRATTLSDYIQGFNCNTNLWVAAYVYKRLKFFNSKLLSQFISLMFLSIWHGLRSGYLITFTFEFIVVFCERDFARMIKRCPHVMNYLRRPFIRLSLIVLKMMYSLVFMGFSLIPFVFRASSDYRVAYYNTSYVGFYLYGLWPIYRYIVKFTLNKFENKLLKKHLAAIETKILEDQVDKDVTN